MATVSFISTPTVKSVSRWRKDRIIFEIVDAQGKLGDEVQHPGLLSHQTNCELAEKLINLWRRFDED